MTQKIFDTENKEDMGLLWSILPDDVVRISPLTSKANRIEFEDDEFSTILLKINWHDKTEITRPVNYEDMIGCVGWFSNKKEDKKYCFGILDIYDDKDESNDGKNFHCSLIGWYKHFTPAKKSELKFYGD
jgi:hypothetical protein